MPSRTTPPRRPVRIAVVGSYGVGLTMRVPRMPVAGETLSGGEFSAGHGGKGSNQAVQAARLGAQVDLFTCIGADDHGRQAQRLWAEEGIAAAPRVVEDAATMAGVILVEPSGENRIVIAPGALDRLTPHDLDAFQPALAAADLVVVSLEIPVAVAVRALELAHDAGTTTLLNPAPAAALPDTAWPAVDILTPNATEAAVLLGLDPQTAADADADQLARSLHQRTGATVILTRGGDGALVCDASGTTAVPAARAEQVVDTTGAGDAFTAAVAVALASGETPVAAAEFGARVGAYVVGHHDVIPALPTAEQLSQQSAQPGDQQSDQHDSSDKEPA